MTENSLSESKKSYFCTNCCQKMSKKRSFWENLFTAGAIIGGAWLTYEIMKGSKKKVMYKCPVCNSLIDYKVNPCPYCDSQLEWSADEEK